MPVGEIVYRKVSERGMAVAEGILLLGLLGLFLGWGVPTVHAEVERRAAAGAEHTIMQIGQALAYEQEKQLPWPCAVCFVTHHDFADIYGGPTDHAKRFVFENLPGGSFAIYDAYQYQSGSISGLGRCPGSGDGHATFIVYESTIGLCSSASESGSEPSSSVDFF